MPDKCIPDHHFKKTGENETRSFRQVLVKVVYEAAVLPVTQYVVRILKTRESIDVIDKEISYNPFRIRDI